MHLSTYHLIPVTCFCLECISGMVTICYYSKLHFNNCIVNKMQSRLDILKIHSRRMNLMRGIDLKKIAEKMNGASGAELKVMFRVSRP